MSFEIDAFFEGNFFISLIISCLETSLNILTKTGNEPKRPETSQNDPKLAEITKKNCKMIQNYKIGEMRNFLLPFIFQTFGPNVQTWYFGLSNL